MIGKSQIEIETALSVDNLVFYLAFTYFEN